MATHVKTLDGNEAAASIAYRTNEVCAIYPITPSSTMGELADQWASEGKTNIWGTVPHVIEMQSEGGAAGTVHGALQTGALTTTFTASQGLLLMIPNMFKIAGELTPAVFHVAARAIATQALSIFGDHSDVMAARMTGWAMLCSSSVQEAHDLALIAQNATLSSRIPFVHFFDGFRTSHEVSRIQVLSDDDVRAMIDDELVFAHRARALDPESSRRAGRGTEPRRLLPGARDRQPVLRGRSRPSSQAAMDRFAALTGRRYRLFDYFGAADAEHVIVLMGSGVETVRETIDYLNGRGAKLGVVQVHLFRPFSVSHLLDAVPQSVKAIAVLDRTKEPGASGEPLYQDVVTAFAEAMTDGRRPDMPRIVGGRYGLASKEFTPAMVKAVFENLAVRFPEEPLHGRHQRRRVADEPRIRPAFRHRGGRRGRLHLLRPRRRRHGGGEQELDQDHRRADPGLRAGLLRLRLEEIRVAHDVAPPLRAAADPIDLPRAARPVHRLPSVPVRRARRDAATRRPTARCFCSTAPSRPDDLWNELPRTMQETLVRKHIRLYIIDADRVATEAGMPGRINTIMQTCFFAISGVLPRDDAIARIKDAIQATYARKGTELVESNFAAVDRALENLHEVTLPAVRDQHPRVVSARARARAGLRQERDGHDDRRARRRAAGQRAPR